MNSKWFDRTDTLQRLADSVHEDKFNIDNLEYDLERLSLVAKQILVESDDTCCYLNLGKSKIEVTDASELSSVIYSLLRFKNCNNPYSYLASVVQSKDLSNWEINNYFDIFENCLRLPLQYIASATNIPLTCLYHIQDTGSAPWDYVVVLDRTVRTFSALLAKLEKISSHIIKSKHSLSVLKDGGELIRIPSHMSQSAIRAIFALDTMCFGCAVDEH